MDFSSPEISIPASPPLPSPACEGDALHMQPMVNLETADTNSRQRSHSVKAQEADTTKETTSLSQYNFFSHFGVDRLLAALSVNHAGYKLLSDYSFSSFFFRSVERFHHLNNYYDGAFYILSNFAYAALNNPNGTYTLREMLKQDDVTNFVEAMIKEVDDHESRKHIFVFRVG